MKFNKKGFAVLLALSLGMSGAALAASADSFSDVPKDHWSYEALDYLAKEGVIEGMGNSTFEGGRTMTRYEVASIVAKAMQKGGGNFGDKTVLEKLHAEYADEINVLQQQVAKNTKQIEQNTKDIQENKEKIDRVKLYGFMRTQYDYDKDTTSGTIDKQTNRFTWTCEATLRSMIIGQSSSKAKRTAIIMTVTGAVKTPLTRMGNRLGPAMTAICSESGSKGRKMAVLSALVVPGAA